jgi:hypothetical protein
MSSILPHFSARLILTATLAIFLVSCGGGGGNSSSQASNNGTAQDIVMSPTPVNTSNFVRKPILTFLDTGLSVTDGITRFGTWGVNSPYLWEFSLNQGATWVRGQGGTFEVSGDGAKNIWVRSVDDMGNTSEIVMVNCVLDTMPPAAVQTTVMSQDMTQLVKVSRLEDQGQWEYSLDDQRTWLVGNGDSLALMGNALTVLWLRQVDLAGNTSPLERILLDSSGMARHEASGNPMQPSLLSLQQTRTVVLHGSVARGDADYIRWDIPPGQSLKAMRLVHYVSADPIAFYALQRAPVFDAGFDVNRMLIYGHMGPQDLKRNVLQNLAPVQLTAGSMTLWFQQTGSEATEYAIELVFQPLQ